MLKEKIIIIKEYQKYQNMWADIQYLSVGIVQIQNMVILFILTYKLNAIQKKSNMSFNGI